jgi:hypothetical protein
MKLRKVRVALLRYPGQQVANYGTCPTWVQQARETVRRHGATLTFTTVMVVNGTRAPCRACNGAHVTVTNPTGV